jgi:hypothetical protein
MQLLEHNGAIAADSRQWPGIRTAKAMSADD